ncbi:unnamed protein product [Effrenium voratum]|uniref:Fungal lipase-type domain-containing protein n=1 Tax=Effrenium voratum TaxID=2562239 RepID=A0AA36JHP3_9DINO|nr:unnamed protein product [Effrenium voratum]
MTTAMEVAKPQAEAREIGPPVRLGVTEPISLGMPTQAEKVLDEQLLEERGVGRPLASTEERFLVLKFSAVQSKVLKLSQENVEDLPRGQGRFFLPAASWSGRCKSSRATAPKFGWGVVLRQLSSLANGDGDRGLCQRAHLPLLTKALLPKLDAFQLKSKTRRSATLPAVGGALCGTFGAVVSGPLLAATGLLGGAGVALLSQELRWREDAEAAEAAPEKRVLELKQEVSCQKTAIAAALSSWIYLSGSRTVRIKRYRDGRKAAYYDYENADLRQKPKGIVPAGWCVPVIKEMTKKGRDGQMHVCLLVRYLSMPVFIWKMHTEDVGRFALVKDEADAYQSAAMENVLDQIPANTQVVVLGEQAASLCVMFKDRQVHVKKACTYALEQCVEIRAEGARFFLTEDMTEEQGIIRGGTRLPRLKSGLCFERDGVAYPWVQVLYRQREVYVWQRRTKEPAFREKEVQQALANILTRKDKVLEVQFPRPGPLSPSCAITIISREEETLVVMAWQGTEFDKRPMDLFTDLAAAPVRAQMWDEHMPKTWVHSGIYAKVQSDVLQHEPALRGKVLEAVSKGRCRVLFTGHSLGGGAALAAHLCFLARWQELLVDDRISLESIAFAAPMVFYLADGIGNPKAQLWQKFAATSQNFVFDRDVVPRLPGSPGFYRDALRTAITTATSYGAERIRLKSDGMLVQSVLNLLEKTLEAFSSDDGLQQTYEQLKNYTHLSQVQFYACDEALEISRSMWEGSRWTPSSKVNFLYLLACHKFFPSRLVYAP